MKLEAKTRLTSSGKEKIAPNTLLQKLAKKLVPANGKCATREGELLRALLKLRYRWYNDGDVFFVGYGCQTCGPAATYLRQSLPTIARPLLDRATTIKGFNDRLRGRGEKSDAAYEAFLDALTEKVVTFVLSAKGDYTKNTDDMLATKSFWIDHDDANDDEDY